MKDGDLVASWPQDLGGVLNTATATFLERPTFKVNVQNGQPALLFDGVKNVMHVAPVITAQPNTMFAVAKQNAIGLYGNAFDGDNGGARQALGYVSNGAGVMGAGTDLMDGVDHSGAFHIFSAVFNGGSSFLYLDGTQIASGNAGTNGQGPTVYIGASPTFSQWLNGYISELIISSSGLGTTDRQNVEAFLGSKYGISVPGGTVISINQSNVPGLAGYWHADSLLDAPVPYTYHDDSGSCGF